MRKSWGRRSVIFLLCAALMIGILPALMPEAKAYEYYDLWVGGTQVNSNNKDDIPPSGNCTSSGGEASYNPVTNTLTLNEYYYMGYSSDTSGEYCNAAIYYKGNKTLKILFQNIDIKTTP